MKILVSTPALGGLVTTEYTYSLLTSHAMATGEGLVEKFDLHFLNSESLIHRARDRAADYFMRGDYDRLITIDSDIQWTWEGFRRLLTSPHDIVGGMYPIKAFPVVANFNPLNPDEYVKTNRGFDYDAYEAFCGKYADSAGILEVRHLATGFLSVSRKVFETLAKDSKVYATFDAVTGERRAFFHFYESGVHEGELESEDWSFIRRARDAGFKAYLDTKIKLGHIGRHTYRMGQFYGSVQS